MFLLNTFFRAAFLSSGIFFEIIFINNLKQLWMKKICSFPLNMFVLSKKNHDRKKSVTARPSLFGQLMYLTFFDCKFVLAVIYSNIYSKNHKIFGLAVINLFQSLYFLLTLLTKTRGQKQYKNCVMINQKTNSLYTVYVF